MILTTIKSPCIGSCQLDPNDRCISCNRSVDEIKNWVSMTDEERDHIINREGIITTLENDLLKSSNYPILRPNEIYQGLRSITVKANIPCTLHRFQVDVGIRQVSLVVTMAGYNNKTSTARIKLYAPQRSIVLNNKIIYLNNHVVSSDCIATVTGPIDIDVVCECDSTIHVSNFTVACRSFF